MKKLIAVVTVLAVSTGQADIIYVDADCPGGDGSSVASSPTSRRLPDAAGPSTTSAGATAP